MKADTKVDASYTSRMLNRNYSLKLLQPGREEDWCSRIMKTGGNQHYLEINVNN